MEITTRKDPIVPSIEAIEDNQRCIYYWGDRCERAEAEIEQLRAALKDAALVIERTGNTGFVVRGTAIEQILFRALEQTTDRK